MPPKTKSNKQTTKQTTKTKQPPSTQPQTQQQPPNWPPLHPLSPPENLTLNTLLPSQILTINPLLTSTLCSKYVTFLRSLPLTTTPGIPKKGNAVRVNDRFQIEDPVFAERLWAETGLKELVLGVDEGEKVGLWGGEVLGLNSNIRIYRYSEGQFFDRHYDDSNTLLFPSPSSPNATPAKTTWTLLLYLTSPATGCKGGETVFYPEAPNKRTAAPPPVVAELEVGMALLHRHGRDCLLHEGREVVEGEKWVVRSDLCVRR